MTREDFSELQRIKGYRHHVEGMEKVQPKGTAQAKTREWEGVYHVPRATKG